MLRKLGRRRPADRDHEDVDVPAGQFVTEKFPVLTAGPTPKLDLETWQLRVFGLVERETVLSWDQFTSLQKRTVEAPFHCVTQWSKMGNRWDGVGFAEIVGLAGLLPEARYTIVHCFGGYSVNLPLEVAMDDDVLFATHHDGEPLAREHGAPLRLVVPKRYGWKSAKWVSAVELMAEETPGFWEIRGYHMNGDPWKEERFWDEFS